MAKKKPAAKKKGKGGAGNSKFMAPVQPDDVLAVITGSKPLPRTKIPGMLWDYIHKHKLQDKNDGRVIHADETLKKIFNGKAKVNMMEMTSLWNKHVKA
ncbi:MAG TPA: SWIB/MDM2 domain-containing protein [Planctomycetota bacterium]|jgi:chromatin remodeling complex protein RSC6|nr:SWIB/MDM2 domain-containing protein [Planctomycetota bacterium]